MSKNLRTADLQALAAEEQQELAMAEPKPAQVAQIMLEDTEADVQDVVQQEFDLQASEHNPGSLGRKWVESFRSFAESPVSIGALAGQALAGIVGGSNAGAAASPIALEFQKMANQRFIAGQRVNALGQRQAQPKLNQNLIHRDTGETLVIQNGQVVDQSGKPVPTDKQKNLLDVKEDRLEKFGGKRIEQRDKRIDLSEKRLEQSERRLGLAADQFVDKQEEDADKKKFSMMSAVRSDNVYKKANEQMFGVEKARVLLEDAFKSGGQSLAGLGAALAKANGEVGVLTDEDVKRYLVNPALVPGARDKIAKILGGRLTEDSYENIRRLLDLSEQSANNIIEKRINYIGSTFSRATKDIKAKDARNILDTKATLEKPKESINQEETVLMLDKRTGKTRKVFKSKIKDALGTGFYKEIK